MNIEQTAEYIQPVLAHPIAPAVDLPKVTPPPLENGDRLTRSEFERRYDAMPHIKKAELIEGVVYMASPVRCESHAQPHSRIMTWLGVYWAATPGIQLADNATVRLDPDNEVQPDALLWLEPELGGNSRISDADYIEGAPELIVEIAASSAAYDLHDKLNVYRRTGVKEYIVWQTYENRLDWFKLYEGEYLPLKPDESGIVHSEIFPGLDLAAEALLKGDLAKVLSELQKGIETAEHAAFVKRLLGE
ncbi:Uma2 family endonuclease [bacterium]|nr:Uma2 family endonuclease [bacterium]